MPKNERLRNIQREILSDNWYVLNKYTYEYLNNKGEWELQQREAYDRGNGATILLYNKAKRTVVLTNQFRMPTYVNGNNSGMMIEACAGLLDGDNPEDCIKKEVEEETGYRVGTVEKVMEIYMSPGSVTEILYFFLAAYEDRQKVGEGGGVASEQENIEVLELSFERAMEMMKTGEIRDSKTIILLQHVALIGLFDD